MKQIAYSLLLIAGLLPVIAPGAFSQQDPLRFKRLGIEQGLSQSTVGYIYQDSRGFMWFGTGMGLNRYDGYTFKVYKHDPEDPGSISDNDIWHIDEDASGALWIGTYGGLNRFDRETETFTHWQYDPENTGRLPTNHVISLLVDRSDVLWLGTEGAGLFQAEIISDTILEFTQWLHNPHDTFSLSNNDVVCLFEDSHGILWIGTDNGLNRFDRTKGKFTCFVNRFGDYTSLSNNYIEGITEDASDALWIATHGGGLNRFDRKTETFERWQYDLGNPNSLSTNYLYSIHADRQGIIWIGTDNAGLDRFDPLSGTFAHYIHQSANPNSLGGNEVISMFEDCSGILWIGTGEGGVSYISEKNRTLGAFVHWKSNKTGSGTLQNNQIWSFQEDTAGYIWIATSGGLSRFDRKSGSFAHYPVDPGHQASLSNYVHSIQVDKDDHIWLATWGGGMYQFDPEHETYTPFPQAMGRISVLYLDNFGNMWIDRYGDGLFKFNIDDESMEIFSHQAGDGKSLSNNYINCLYEDSRGSLWIGTKAGGLNKFDRANRTFENWQIKPNDPYSLSSNEVNTIYEDKSGRLWIGTAYGLNRFDQKNGKFFRYGEKEGLPNDVICCILEDDASNLWVSTHKGLSKFNPATEGFRNYFVQDGLQSNEFSRGACLKTRNGEMFFGGINGFNSFYPDSIRDNPHIPPVVITDLQVFNKSVKISNQGKTPLRKHISESREVVLNYSDRVFSFEFAALDYNAPERNQYAYMMEGFDQDWIEAGTRRFATYTNLNHGQYVFRVKASNNDGVWNEEGASVRIIITPPWWKTWQAYTLYIFLIAILLYGISRFELSKARLANELKMQNFEAEKLRELDQAKSHFFANISHEFRTPLTLIIGPLKQLLSGEFQGDTKAQFRIMLRNSQRLLRMINQLLDLSRLEAGKLTLRARPENLIPLLKQILSSFESLARRKQIAFTFHASKEPIVIYLDRDKFEKIMYNLLSNAFKFTPEGGTVSVQMTIPENPDSDENTSQRPARHVQITVKDSGSGIPPDQIDNIFDRFYQVSYPGSSSGEEKASSFPGAGRQGTGIGLTLTKELVELHGGNIRVESEPGKRSTFSIYLPLGKAHLKPDQIVSDTSTPVGQEPLPDGPVVEEAPEKAYLPPVVKADKREAPLLLIVDDNADMRKYIRMSLDNKYTIVEASNGAEGFEKAVEVNPSLIISDVMMPMSDGIAFCKNIKTNWETSHIPIILLTAKASDDDKIEGLETGADDYLTKPFNTTELLIRIRNLLEQRKRLKEKFSKEIKIIPDVVTSNSLDYEFLNRALSIAKENLSNTSFDSESFAKEMCLSRSQLHRKLQAITGFSTGEFLRSFRLKHAAQLLVGDRYSVTQIAFEVGFNSPSHFTKAFRQQFDCLPSEFKNKVVPVKS